ncbi:programmed cell death protein 2-like [Impatiens glandulifera]|uniref:programmed cell death protein 2-like n=1 Tax=Impatiens glandulifera TaxID=253017 RepID=UPI001FB0E8DD|nr:programmed cell death protein 2-like [Impatiens glandulifera]
MEKVYLGMPESWAKDKSEQSDHYTTKVGGLPDWPMPISAIDSNLLICSKCGSNLCLVTQVYAPLFTDTLKIEERTLYVLGCIASKCGSSQESWRVLRLQKASPSNGDSELACDNKSLMKLDTEDDHDDGSETDNYSMSLEELGDALAASLSCIQNEHNNNHNKGKSKNVPKHSTTKKTTKVADKLTPVLPCFYIYPEEEKTCSKNIATLCPNLASISITNENGQEQEETWLEEAYEYDKALTADRTFLKFKKRLNAYPEQCFRYSYGGNPLLPSAKSEDSGSCKHCGGLRNYEMQLMSPLLYFLQDQEKETKEHCSLDNWNWLTLIVHTCSNSCFLNQEEDSNRSDGGWCVIEEAIAILNDDDDQ